MLLVEIQAFTLRCRRRCLRLHLCSRARYASFSKTRGRCLEEYGFVNLGIIQTDYCSESLAPPEVISVSRNRAVKLLHPKSVPPNVDDETEREVTVTCFRDLEAGVHDTHCFATGQSQASSYQFVSGKTCPTFEESTHSDNEDSLSPFTPPSLSSSYRITCKSPAANSRSISVSLRCGKPPKCFKKMLLCQGYQY